VKELEGLLGVVILKLLFETLAFFLANCSAASIAAKSNSSSIEKLLSTGEGKGKVDEEEEEEEDEEDEGRLDGVFLTGIEGPFCQK